MTANTTGIHHITAMAGDAQKNVDFYVRTLGLRMVKKTVNFDDPYTYHLYFGDENGSPGTIMTFFPWSDRGLKGRVGLGQATTVAFSVPFDAINYWAERLKSLKITATDIYERFDEKVISFEDTDGIFIDIVASKAEDRDGWDNGEIPKEFSIRSFHSVTLSVVDEKPTAEVLKKMGARFLEKFENRYRYVSGDEKPGTIVDLLVPKNARYGTMGVGTIHHVAWRAADKNEQLELRKTLTEAGFNVTPVLDRNYFESIYFREPGGVLFEIATDPPGFEVDENLTELGTALKLPEWLETRRAEIEEKLPKIQ